MEITIANLRNEKPTQPYHVRVDRGTPLGNPFIMNNEAQRLLVIIDYENWIKEQIAKKNETVCKELNRLFLILKKYNKLRLFCWCAPKKCHAEIIKKILLEAMSNKKSKKS